MRYAAGHIDIYPFEISHSAAISAREKGQQWVRALTLLEEMWQSWVEPSRVSWYGTYLAQELAKQRHELCFV